MVIIGIFIFLFSNFPNCSLKDYLNFYCITCDKNLCKEHYHHPVNCPFSITSEKLNGKKEENFKIYKNQSLICSNISCKEEIFNSIGYECKLCRNIFCLKHRIESDHNCIKKKVSYKEKYDDNKYKFKEKLNQLKNKK